MGLYRKVLLSLALGAASVAVLAAPAVAVNPPSATTPNLLANGDFENSTPFTSPFITVLSGDSTTIPGWTVVTPSVYGGSSGSIDLKVEQLLESREW